MTDDLGLWAAPIGAVWGLLLSAASSAAHHESDAPVRFALATLAMMIALTPSPRELTNDPPLPYTNGALTIPVKVSANGPTRALELYIHYPAENGHKPLLEDVGPNDGLMLDLHNWGGTTFEGAPDPDVLANAFHVVVIGVRYYQSGGDHDSSPYDFGYHQALEALSALSFVERSLRDAHHPFDATRIYGVGGSGGGNVIQMANKLAPHTFAAIVDLSGMASLTDDIAYDLPGGSSLTAHYRQDSKSTAYLSKDMQEIRDLGNLTHLALQARLGSAGKIVVIHGEDDSSCLAADKHRVVDAMRAAGLDVDAHFVSKSDIDGTLVRDSEHTIGNRTDLLLHFAGAFLSPQSATMRRLTSPNDFERGAAISYPTTNGEYVVSYEHAPPSIEFTAVRHTN